MELQEHAREAAFTDLAEYPKTIVLKDGSKVILRPMVLEDGQGLLEFFTGLPDQERLFLRDDVINPEVVESWADSIDSERILTILAVDGERIVGHATLYCSPFTWNRHVGSLRFTVSPDYRGKGLARVLAAEVFSRALPSGLEKLVSEVVLEQDDVRSVLFHLGFREEAVLRGQHRNAGGENHDVVIMANDLNQLWKIWLEYCESVSGTWHMED